MGTSENHDDHKYHWVMFERETLLFVVRSIDFYISLLGDEEAELASHPDLAALITEEVRGELGLKRDKERTARVKAWLEEKLSERGDSWGVDLSPSHWLIRFMKSVGLLYLAKLRTSRNALASGKNVTASTLSAVDREISAKEEMFSSTGVFKDASQLQLLASYGRDSDLIPLRSEIPETSLLSAARPRPILVESIEILDHELRTRCLDLFNQFQESGEYERNDTVVSEATRVLENRLRTLISGPDGKSAKQLIAIAFNLDNPVLIVSDVRAEQEAAQLLFLGTFGFIRNQVQHKLLGSMPAERVLQILGWVDYLLSILAKASRSDAARQ